MARIPFCHWWGSPSLSAVVGLGLLQFYCERRQVISAQGVIPTLPQVSLAEQLSVQLHEQPGPTTAPLHWALPAAHTGTVGGKGNLCNQGTFLTSILSRHGHPCDPPPFFVGSFPSLNFAVFSIGTIGVLPAFPPWPVCNSQEQRRGRCGGPAHQKPPAHICLC